MRLLHSFVKIFYFKTWKIWSISLKIFTFIFLLCVEGGCYQFSMFCNKNVILSSYIFIMATDQRSNLCIDINHWYLHTYNITLLIKKNLHPLISSLHSTCPAKIKLLFSSKWLQNLRVNSWQNFLLLHFGVSSFISSIK